MTIHPESPPLTPNWWILTSTGGGRSVGTSTSPVLQRSGTPVPAVTPATNRDVRDGQSEPLSLRTPPRPASPDEATTVTAERRGVLEPRAAEAADTQMPSHAERRAKRSLRSWSPYLSKSSMHAATLFFLVLAEAKKPLSEKGTRMTGAWCFPLLFQIPHSQRSSGKKEQHIVFLPQRSSQKDHVWK